MEISNNYNRYNINFNKRNCSFMGNLKPLEKDVFISSQKNQKSVDERLNAIINKLSKTREGREDIFIKNLSEVAKIGTENNPQLLEKRTKLLEDFGEKYPIYLDKIVFLNFTKKGHPELVLDNLDEIGNLLSNADPKTEYMQMDFFKNINEKSVEKMLELKDVDSLTTAQKVAIIVHSAQEHQIEFGDEEVEVDSSEIISLLTGINSISTKETGSCDEFNSIVRSVTEKSHRDDDLTYYKIAEGILTQRPDLVQICNMYEDFIDAGHNDLMAEKDFFELLDKTEKLSKKIKLKTIVPDENAMILPEMTKIAFEFRNNQFLDN